MASAPAFKQSFDHGEVTVFAGERKRRDVVIICGIDGSARPQQALDRIHIVPMGGPLERRGAVRLRGVDVDALLQQLLERGAVLSLGGIRQPVISCGRGRADQRSDAHEDPDEEPWPREKHQGGAHA